MLPLSWICLFVNYILGLLEFIPGLLVLSRNDLKKPLNIKKQPLLQQQN